MAAAGPRLLLALALVALKQRPIEWPISEYLRTVAPPAEQDGDEASTEALTIKELRTEVTRLRRRCHELESQVDGAAGLGAEVSNAAESAEITGTQGQEKAVPEEGSPEPALSASKPESRDVAALLGLDLIRTVEELSESPALLQLELAFALEERTSIILSDLEHDVRSSVDEDPGEMAKVAAFENLARALKRGGSSRLGPMTGPLRLCS